MVSTSLSGPLHRTHNPASDVAHRTVEEQQRQARAKHHASSSNTAPQVTLEMNEMASDTLPGLSNTESRVGSSATQLAEKVCSEWLNNSHSRQFAHALMNFYSANHRAQPALAGASQTSGQGGASQAALASCLELANSIKPLLENAPGDWPPRVFGQAIYNQAKQLADYLGSEAAAPDKAERHASFAESVKQQLNNDVTPSTPPAAQDEEGHHGGVLVVDLDEAIHGLYAAISYAVKAMQGNSDEVAREFKDKAALLAESPIGWAKQENSVHGALDFGMNAGVGGILLPFSVMAMHAGVEEIQGALQQGKKLNEIKGTLGRELSSLEQAPRVLSENRFITARQRRLEHQVELMAFLDQQNWRGGMIGVASLLSGATIALKSMSEVASQAASYANKESAAASAATGIVGLSSTFALGPVAALSALALGAYMAKASGASQQNFARLKKDADATITSLRPVGPEDTAIGHYADFMKQKLGQHESFYNYFSRWNKGFLAGSGIYTAGTLGKVGTVGAVAAGASALADPATLATIVALGAAGGMTMAASTHQFFAGHGRHQRYLDYQNKGDVMMDRPFMEIADVLGATHGDSSGGPLAGLALRSEWFKTIYQHEERRQDLMQAVAADTGHEFSDSREYTADTPQTLSRRPPQASTWDRLSSGATQLSRSLASAARAGSTMMRQSGATGAPETDLESNRPSTPATPSKLTQTHVMQWIDAAPQNKQRVYDMMKDTLDDQIAFTQQRMEVKREAYESVSPQLDQLKQEGVALAEGEQLAAVLSGMGKELSEDDALYWQLLQTRSELDAPGSDAEQSAIIERYIGLQNGKLIADDQQQREDTLLEGSLSHLVDYLFDEAPARYRDLRGMLVDTELQASTLRQQFHDTITDGSSSPAPQSSSMTPS